jgi:hypothetical protein
MLREAREARLPKQAKYRYAYGVRLKLILRNADTAPKAAQFSSSGRLFASNACSFLKQLCGCDQTGKVLILRP